MSAASEFAELLKLIEVSGPFLSLPVFKETFPQGFAKDSSDLTREIKELYSEWSVARLQAHSSVSPAEREWLSAVFKTLLGWPAEWFAEDNAIPQNLSYFVALHHETLRPDAVLIEDGKPRLLITILPPAQQPDKRPPGTTWNASHAARMAELLHATRVPLGLVTNGERFTVVYAELGQPTGFADFRAELWFDERLTLRAFRDFLSADALFNRSAEQTLDALYRLSLENQQEVSTTLGRQVRRAVEMFVAALDRADRESSRALLASVSEEHIYEASLSLMMRLVFLFFAEERDLLPTTNPVYRENYAVTTLHYQLREAADRLGEEVLERRYDAFPRLLATFRAVHGGIAHDMLALPAYGGDLFDPDRFAFLEGRATGSSWKVTSSQPFPIHNRTILHLLEALQFLEMKVPGGGRERRRVSFRALDIEQIGHVYEGLLDHTVRRATDIVLGLEGKEEPEIPLSELITRSQTPDFADWLADETGRTRKAIESALKETTVDDPLRWPEWERVALFSGLVRRDDNGDPCVIPAGSIYVAAGAARRQTGTQYTPRSLTESVVEHALEPVAYTGPAEGNPPEAWQLKSAQQLLELKICDFACGSGAFLVAGTRYLAARLVEAWTATQRELGEHIRITPYGHPSKGSPEEELIPTNPDERYLYALRIVVERCIYGVDRNMLAVEMAKLSLWLLTLQRNRPFTFLNHAIRCGDSLLGVTRPEQIESFDFSAQEHEERQITFWREASKVLFQRTLEYRLKLESFAVVAPADVQKKEALLRQAEDSAFLTRIMCDLLVGAALATATGKRPQEDESFAKKRADLWRELMKKYAYDEDVDSWRVALEAMQPVARELLDVGLPVVSVSRRPFHWPLEFPEVFVNQGGFDALVGNPPFIGGQRITAALGGPYRDYLIGYIASGKRGSADYVAYFFLRAASLLKKCGSLGLLSTNSICQGDTRQVGLDQLANSFPIYRAVSSRLWPGEASVYYAAVWATKGSWRGCTFLDETSVDSITPMLTPQTSARYKPFQLVANQGKCIKGSEVGGMEAFILTEVQARGFIAMDRKAEAVVRPFLGYEDLVANARQRTQRWSIYFSNWPLEKAKLYSDCFRYVDTHTREKRRGSWWQFRRSTPDLYRAIEAYERVLVIGETSEAVSPIFVENGQIFSKTLIVFTDDRWSTFAVIQSGLHYSWILQYSSTLTTRVRYIITDTFETFPFPVDASPLDRIGEQFHELRAAEMLDRAVGFTDFYNAFHNPANCDAGIVNLRTLQSEMDYGVAAAYGWTDVDLGHSFHETKQGIRFTISAAARREVLDRLLGLNHERYAQEQAPVEESRPKRKKAKRVTAHPELF